jgi:glycosyltransferase involved in cell wall biosynthesis
MNKASSKKILFIGPYPPPFGGIANQMKLLLESKLQYEFDILKLNINLPSEKTEIVSEKKRINWKKIYVGLYKLILLLYTEKPRVIYIQMNASKSCFREMLYMAITRLFSKTRIVLHFHGALKQQKKNFPFIIQQKNNIFNKLVINTCFNLAHRIIFLSKMILDEFKPILSKRNLKRSLAIENFTAIELFVPFEKEKNTINILFVGRLSKAKGFFDIISIVQDIISQVNNVVFHFCGAPENERSLLKIKSVLQKLQRIGHIKLHGLVYGGEKKRIFSESDIMLLPTHVEVFPITILEGLAQGLPIITTNVSVIPTIIEEGKNGFLIEPGDIEALKDKLMYLLKNHDLRKTISNNNRKKAAERFDIAIAVQKLRQIFNEENRLWHK